MKAYLNSKVEKFSMEDNYCQIFKEKSSVKELSQILNLDEKDVEELRQAVLDHRNELDLIQSKAFVYGEMQSLVGVFKVKNERPSRE